MEAQECSCTYCMPSGGHHMSFLGSQMKDIFLDKAVRGQPASVCNLRARQGERVRQKPHVQVKAHIKC